MKKSKEPFSARVLNLPVAIGSFIAVVWILFFAVSCEEKEDPVLPNIIFIMADDLGYADTGVYGQQLIKTPNINELAKEGMRFTQCYAGSSVCAPSRSVLILEKQREGRSAR